MASNSSQQDIAKIDEEIRALENRIFSLRSTRNTLVPIGHLPAEVLQTIFNIAQCQGTQTIHLSWVSHTWRSLVIGSKSLWTLINNSNLDWASLYLERSFPMPLVITFREAFDERNLFLMIVEQLYRIKALIMPQDDWDFSSDQVIQDVFLQHGTSPLPHIELLRLTEGEITHDMLLSLRNARHLSFRWCDHHWSTQPPVPFPYLRSLSLSSLDKEISVHDLLDHLESMPALQTLILEQVFEPISDEDSRMARRLFTNGPRLATLTMDGSQFETSLVFLQKAGCITRETNTALQMYLADGPLDRVEEVLGAFNGWATVTGHTQGITRLAFDTSERESIIIEYGGVEGSPGCAHLQASIRPHIIHNLAIFPVISRSLPLQNLQFLLVHIDAKMESWQPITDAFGQLPQLQHIVVLSRTDALLHWLSMEDTQMHNGDPPHHPYFSALTTLSFPSSPPSAVALFSCLQSRQRHGLKLKTLTLSNRHIMEVLRELAGPNLDNYTDNLTYGGDSDFFGKDSCYRFLQRVEDNLDIPLDISSMVL
ncbi:hypothetical protein BDN72DRAFT_837504 [Pluteus cervinus]|uniref:Uncharacterized protein n=1 Tax=Pluteus cervinus TaxID=181527 RepID=A0ACD3B0Z0_9AGAR|nr:hypothetical protein BDN72DRAFT_837504 [Pluteus cervinus]